MKALSELAGVLGQAPDPQPYLNALSPLQERISELHRENRRLQLHGQAAENEASSASQAVGRNRELERENAELKAQLREKVLISTPSGLLQPTLWHRAMWDCLLLPWQAAASPASGDKLVSSTAVVINSSSLDRGISELKGLEAGLRPRVGVFSSSGPDREPMSCAGGCKPYHVGSSSKPVRESCGALQQTVQTLTDPALGGA